MGIKLRFQHLGELISDAIRGQVVQRPIRRLVEKMIAWRSDRAEFLVHKFFDPPLIPAFRFRDSKKPLKTLPNSSLIDLRKSQNQEVPSSFITIVPSFTLLFRWGKQINDDLSAVNAWEGYTEQGQDALGPYIG